MPDLNPRDFRYKALEQQRIADLIELVPTSTASVLDVGARDGYVSSLLADRVSEVTALDLARPVLDDHRVRCVKGDVRGLPFSDGEFDLVLCAEVLEHLMPADLHRACNELARVSSRWLLIGVPDRQDLRVGRTTCSSCGGFNPPWGHVNSFDEAGLAALFPGFLTSVTHRVGQTRERSNAVSAALLDWAGNPFGTYQQDEACIHCGGNIGMPGRRSITQRVLSKVGTMLQHWSTLASPQRAKWIHLLLVRE